MKSRLVNMVGAIALSGIGAAHAGIIDNFDGALSFDVTSTGAPVSTAAGVSSSGFARILSTSGSDSNVVAAINRAPNVGEFAHSQGAGVVGISTVEYSLNATNLLTDGIDFFNAFRIVLTGVDLNGIIRVSVDGQSVDVTTTDILIENGLNLPATVDIVFADFVGADLSSVNALALSIDGLGQAALDATIDSIATVCTDQVVTDGGAGTLDPASCRPNTQVSSVNPLALLGLAALLLAGRCRWYT